jgi:hypothetical protein
MSDVIKVAPSKWRWVRTAGVAVAVLLLIGWLAWSAVGQKDADWLTLLPSFIGSLASHWVGLLSGGAGVVAVLAKT